MKNIIKITLITVLALGLNTGRAMANDEAAAAIGGFVIGMITGAVIDHHDSDVRVSVRHDRGRGHYETRRVRVWVPGFWDVRVSRCGDRVRVWQSGHYTWRHEKVWVSYRDRDRRGHDRDYRGHGDNCRKDCCRGRDNDRHRKERWFRG